MECMRSKKTPVLIYYLSIRAKLVPSYELTVIAQRLKVWHNNIEFAENLLLKFVCSYKYVLYCIK